MKAFEIVIILLIIIEAVILISNIFCIINAAKKGIRLTAFTKGIGFNILCGVVAAGTIFSAALFFSELSECKREIADYRERGSAVYMEKYPQSITIVDEDEFVSHQIELDEKRAAKCLDDGLIMIFWSTTSINYILCDLIFVTKKGIILIKNHKNKALFADIEGNELRINGKNKNGSYTVCKLKNTPKNQEILNPYIR